jgi:hypothetical protein
VTRQCSTIRPFRRRSICICRAGSGPKPWTSRVRRDEVAVRQQVDLLEAQVRCLPPQVLDDRLQPRRAARQVRQARAVVEVLGVDQLVERGEVAPVEGVQVAADDVDVGHGPRQPAPRSQRKYVIYAEAV